MDAIDLVMPAAGSGCRIGGCCPKQFAPLGGIPMLIHPLRIFESIPWIGRKIIVHPPGMAVSTQSILENHGISNFVLVEGGASRQESVRRGLDLAETECLITHNAAVALVTKALVEQLRLEDADCVTTALPQQYNLIKGADWAESAVPRTELQVVNSPQLFVTEALRSCHQRASEEGFAALSDAELLLRYGYKVRLVPGNSLNFKITTPIDHALAELLLDRPELCSPPEQ